jgi:predicted AlkP superfamily phosphohydrolase/phosphomutase
MQSDATHRVMIIGLDGATLDLIRPWAEAGILPTFRKLMREGAWGTLRSTMPPLTPMAWSSFMTGVNAGKHGVYEFTARREGTYSNALVNSSHRPVPSLWQLASRAGKRVIVYNVPLTYPPERVNGLMVSGLMTPPGAKDASYPPELQKDLEEAVPGSTASFSGFLKRGREAEYVRGLLDTHEKNFRAARYLMDRQPWDLFVMVFQNTDIVGHVMWKHMEDKGAGLPESVREIAANAIRDVYRDIDAKLAQLMQAAGEETRVVVMSDHGHGRVKHAFRVNNWLLAKRYIKLREDALTRFKYLLFRLGFTEARFDALLSVFGFGDRIEGSEEGLADSAKGWLSRIFVSFDDIDWSRTRAYSHGYAGPIFANLKGREPNGSVEPGAEYDALLDQLTSDLEDLKELGGRSPLVGEIHRGHEVYSGPLADRSPDLVFYPRDWRYVSYGLKSFRTNRLYTPMLKKTGQHRMDGILFMSGPGIRAAHEISQASIMDIAPTILALLGVPVPQHMDGRILEAVMTPELLERLNFTYTDADGSKPDLAPVAEMSPEDLDILTTRLRNLGYIA